MTGHYCSQLAILGFVLTMASQKDVQNRARLTLRPGIMTAIEMIEKGELGEEIRRQLTTRIDKKHTLKHWLQIRVIFHWSKRI